MGAITVRLTEELQALVDGEVRSGGHASAEAYIQSLLMDEHGRKAAELQAAIDEGEASGILEGDGFEIIERTLAEARERFRSRTA